MCATTKYVSCSGMSTGVLARKMPESPPIANMATNESACIIGTENLMLPRQSVPSQLKVLMADGTAMTMVESMKDAPSIGCMPLMNMWWPQTIQPMKPIEMMAHTIAL